jgi:hypothetical protein
MAWQAKTCMECFRRPVIDRVMERIEIDRESGCWIFPGTKTIKDRGYGQVSTRVGGHRRMVLAHLVTYEHYVGPVPEGLEIDHLCSVAACVNPDHLEPVTHAENMRRARDRRLFREAQ